MSLLPHYIHHVNPKLKHTYLSFDDEGTLIIKSPKVSTEYLERLLLNKSSWINNARKRLSLKKGKSLTFQGNELVYYRGEAYPLSLVPYEKRHTKLQFNGEIFILNYSVYDPVLFQKHIDNFYKKRATEYLPSIVEIWSQKMEVSYSDISFRKTKRQWGSCSSRNKLSFNTMVMKLPEHLIQYIVIHELAHITHKHHQKKFWDFVVLYLPEYKTHIQELKEYTT